MRTNNKFTSIKHQQGWTMWSIMFVAGVLILFTYVGFQLVPVYSTNASVKNAMQVTIDEISPNKVSRADIIRRMTSQFTVDGNHDLLDFKKDLEVKRTQRELIMKVNYESRVELFYNLSLVATFENEVKRSL